MNLNTMSTFRTLLLDVINKAFFYQDDTVSNCFYHGAKMNKAITNNETEHTSTKHHHFVDDNKHSNAMTISAKSSSNTSKLKVTKNKRPDLKILFTLIF